MHSDVLGPVGGSNYFITSIDDYSKWATVYSMRNKSESLECFKKFHMYAETHTGNKLQRLLLHQYNSSPGSEKIKFCALTTEANTCPTTSRSTCLTMASQHQLTVAYTPQQNGLAERMNRTLMNLVRSMLHHKGIDKRF